MRTEEKIPVHARRAALYIRVSTDEQARKGYSLPAQRDALETYAKAHGYLIAGVYIDDGVSAHQVYTKRRGLMRLLADVEADKIDTVLIIKLDRWFRSVKEYYKVQEILDRHHVAWKTTLEDYETETSQGIMMVNIMLSVAQAESDRTSDRIKFVFENKIERGEVVTGAVPLGLKIENKHLVHDPETVEKAREMFRHYMETGSIGETMRYMRESQGVSLHTSTLKHALTNRIYKGEYRDNAAYCTPVIEPELFDRVQDRLRIRSIRRNKTGRIYLFSGLVVCKECGLRMCAQYYGKGGYSKVYYRCNKALLYHECSHNKLMPEERLERWLLENVALELDRWEAAWKLAASAPKKPKQDREAVLRKMDRLKVLYVDGLITKEQYRVDYEKLSAALSKAASEAEPPAPDFAGLRHALTNSLPSAYASLDSPSRRSFWNGIISRIELNVENEPALFFHPYFTISV